MFLISGLIMGVALVGFAFSESWYLSIALVVFIGIAQTANMTLSSTVTQYYVEPQYRGLGIGKALQLRRMDAMIALGATKIITNADLPESIAWYIKNFGYKIIGTIKKIHEFGNPVIDNWTKLELDIEEIRR